MQKTTLQTALVYGWNRFGLHKLTSDVYFEEGLEEKVVIHSYRTSTNLKKHLAKHKPDIIIVFKTIPKELQEINDDIIKSKIIYRDEILDDNVLANDIVCQSTFWHVNHQNFIVVQINHYFQYLHQLSKLKKGFLEPINHY